MTEAIDAIVLAGDRGGSRGFAGANKNFLKVAGRPLIARVITALDTVARVERVTIAGPVQQISELLAETSPSMTGNTEFFALEQGDTAYDNFWSSFLHLLGRNYRIGDEESDRSLSAKPVLVVPGDTPLICPEEIDEFLDGCCDEALDYGVGMTEEQHLARFRPVGSKPGIEFNYLHLSTGSFRLNNLHFARPFHIQNRAYIEEIYLLRYQKQIVNMMRVIGDILGARGLGLRPVSLYLRLQLSLLFQTYGFDRLLAHVRRGITPEKITRIACTLLQANVRIIETTDGRSAIDVDNEADYRTLCERFDEFSRT